jgi:hypothetical protein
MITFGVKSRKQQIAAKVLYAANFRRRGVSCGISGIFVFP